MGPGLALPLIPMWVFDRAVPAGDTTLLALLVLLSLGLTLAGALARIVQQHFQIRFRQEVALSVRSEVMGHVLALPPTFFDREDTGYLMSRVAGDVMQVEGLLTMQLFRVVLDVGKFLGGAIILFALNWKLAAVAAAVLPFFIVTITVFRRPVRNASNELMEAHGSFFKALQEVFSGIALIKALGRGREEAGRVVDKVRGVFAPQRRSTLLTSASSGAAGLVTAAGMAAVLGYGAYEVIHGRTTVGVILAFLGYLGYLYGPSRSLTDFPVQIQPSLVALRRTLAVLGVADEPSGGIEPDAFSGEIRFDKVTFSYPGSRPVLDEADLAVRGGEKLGIAGRTGVGKSTMLKLAMGLYSPEGGRITHDGLPVSDFAPRAYRSSVAYLAQGPFFFSDTVESNLRWASPKAGAGEIAAALETAQAAEFVEGLPEGLATPIGEGGKKLSGGEKQRLALARALLMGPEVLFMDEGTSDLDEATEARILDNVLERFRGRTVILVSHRPSALNRMDRVVHLREGKVHEGE
jgi:subfamily B ATP-binding cassette protein MsbA